MNEIRNPKQNRARQLKDQPSSEAPPSEAEEETTEDEQVAVLIRVVPPWLVSMLIHVGLILLLAILTLAQLPEKQVSLTVDSVDHAEDFEEITIVEFKELDLEQDTSLQSTIDSSDMETTQVTSPVALQTTEVFDLSDLNAALGDVDQEFETISEKMGTTRFFGAEQSGQKFVFVVDNSNSMGRGKLETALNELDKTVNDLSSKQQFHVIFFSDTAYLMFHPKPVKTLVRATDENKERLREWLYSLERCLRTKGEDAMKAAIAMKPDVIYILGDGAFTDNTERLLTAPHNRRIVINTLGMQVNDKGERQLKAIAKANKGKYRHVEAAPGTIEMARKNPIKANNIRGKVWGITLPLVKKKK